MVDQPLRFVVGGSGNISCAYIEAGDHGVAAMREGRLPAVPEEEGRLATELVLRIYEAGGEVPPRGRGNR